MNRGPARHGVPPHPRLLRDGSNNWKLYVNGTDYNEPRPVLMSRRIAEALGVVDRWTPVDDEGGSGVATVTEAELRSHGATWVDWHEPDANGWYTPALYVVDRPSGQRPTMSLDDQTAATR